MIKYIHWNNNSPVQIKKAERAKTRLENQGYTLLDTLVNSISGDCTLTYKLEEYDIYDYI